jgi:hypothetical protein
MDKQKRRWLIALKDEDGNYHYYPDEDAFFIGDDLEVHVESEKRANEWEKKHGCICFGILCEAHGLVEETSPIPPNNKLLGILGGIL